MHCAFEKIMKNPSTAPGSYRPQSNRHVLEFVEQFASLTRPRDIFWCDGSEAEREHLEQRAVGEGVLTPLDSSLWPGCFHHRSNPNDVARVEQLTVICTETREEAGPTNNWKAPGEMREMLERLLEGGMEGRTLFVVPYLMGPPDSPMSRVGVELTDSIYVVLNMRIMARMGAAAWERLGDGSDFNRGIHALLDCDPERRWIAHFPQENTIISVGSGYGGNALLGKKCMALRIASHLGRQEGWFAEHMLLLAVESPVGERFHVAAAFPSACGKTNFAMMIPPPALDGWKVRTIGDDIAWMWPDGEGRLRAINPESGYFGVAPGTGARSNPNAMQTVCGGTIFTNTGLTPDGRVWWEGMDDSPPVDLRDWRGEPWTPDAGRPCAHPNSRFTAPMRNNPMLSEEVENPRGVVVDAIIFGGRRANTVPLVFQAFGWEHGVYTGASVGSEMTAAAAGTVGRARRDPMAMLPFCGYHMGDYFQHWLDIGKRLRNPPHIFHVNWFRKGNDGRFLWPGFGENMRVLKWIVERCRGDARGMETPLGWMPDYTDLDLEGLEDQVTPDDFAALQEINPDEWTCELLSREAFFATLESRLPHRLSAQHDVLRQRLAALCQPAASSGV